MTLLYILYKRYSASLKKVDKDSLMNSNLSFTAFCISVVMRYMLSTFYNYSVIETSLLQVPCWQTTAERLVHKKQLDFCHLFISSFLEESWVAWREGGKKITVFMSLTVFPPLLLWCCISKLGRELKSDKDVEV